MPCRFAHEIDGRERHIGRVLVQHLNRSVANLSRMLRLRAFPKPAEDLEPASAYDLLGGLRACAEDSGDFPRIGKDRAERERYMDLFGRHVTVEVHSHVFRPGGLAGLHHPSEHRADRVPYLRPHFAARPTVHPRMFSGTQKRDVCVVVQQRVVGSPPYAQGKA